MARTPIRMQADRTNEAVSLSIGPGRMVCGTALFACDSLARNAAHPGKVASRGRSGPGRICPAPAGDRGGTQRPQRERKGVWLGHGRRHIANTHGHGGTRKSRIGRDGLTGPRAEGWESARQKPRSLLDRADRGLPRAHAHKRRLAPGVPRPWSARQLARGAGRARAGPRPRGRQQFDTTAAGCWRCKLGVCDLGQAKLTEREWHC